MICQRCGKWAGAHATLPGQPRDHLCMCQPSNTPMDWQALNDALENMLRETVARGDSLAPGWRDEVRAIVRNMVAAERERCALICDELGQHWSDYKDTALLNGDVELSNAASGEPRAAAAIAAAIRRA